MNCDRVWPLIEGLLDAVWLVDEASLAIVAVNSAACSLFGASPDQLIGRPVGDLAATPEDQCFWDDVAAGLSNGIFSDSLIRRFDGRVVPVSRRVTRLPGDERTPSLFLVAMHDRAAQRHAEEERETLLAEMQATLDSTADGILVCDLNGGIRWFNEQFVALWAIPAPLLRRRDAAGVQAFMRDRVVDAGPLGNGSYRQRLREIEDAIDAPSHDVLALNSGRLLERVSHPQSRRGFTTGRVFSFRDVTPAATHAAGSGADEAVSHRVMEVMAASVAKGRAGSVFAGVSWGNAPVPGFVATLQSELH
ncbi:MAG: diguanylate cyclase [Rhizobacter sp.]|nr:diguanylate cyclase [Rhizobacter sp.]